MIGFIKKNTPNTLTCCNLIAGAMATYQAFGGQTKWAFLLIVIGAVFDFFDGMVARLLHVSSPIGKELDSLADVITFGLAPSAMLFTQLHAMTYPSICIPLQSYIPYIAFVMAAFSALRLAKFNLDDRQTTSFIGLPTPANALFWASLLTGFGASFASFTWALPVLILFIFIFSYLLVSEIPMFALKFKTYALSQNKLKYGFIVFSGIVLAFLGVLNGFWVVIALYICISCITALKCQ